MIQCTIIPQYAVIFPYKYVYIDAYIYIYMHLYMYILAEPYTSTTYGAAYTSLPKSDYTLLRSHRIPNPVQDDMDYFPSQYP